MQARADDTVTAMTPLNMTADDTSLTADTTMMTAVPPPGILKTYDQVSTTNGDYHVIISIPGFLHV